MRPVPMTSSLLVAAFACAQEPVVPTRTMAVGWIVRHQDVDGRFDAAHFWKHDPSDQPCDGPGEPFHDVGVTALGLLALLGDGSTMRMGRHKDRVRRAVEWLCAQETGEGRIGRIESRDAPLDHALATLVLAEAAMVSSSQVLAARVPRWLEALAATGPDPQATSRPHAARELTLGFAALACIVARDLGRWPQDDARLRAWLREAAPRPAGLAGEAAAILLRAAAGDEVARDSRPAVIRLRQSLERDWQADSAVDPATLILASLASLHVGGEELERLAAAVCTHVPRTMRLDGSFAGSFDPCGTSGRFGGRIAATVLNLQAWNWAEQCLRMAAHRPPADRKRYR